MSWGQRYGVAELKQTYQKNFAKALTIAIVLHLAGFFGYYALTGFGEKEEKVVRVRIVKYTDLAPPPSLVTQTVPSVNVKIPEKVVKPSIGIPVPVPDAEVSPEQTIPTQEELSQIGPVDSVGQGGNGGGGSLDSIKVEEEPDINAFVPVEKEPVPVKKVTPVYPDIAKRAGLEGKVWVKALINKEGKVKKAVIFKSDHEIFNQPSLDAVMQWVFTAALMNNGPVEVWVVIPFNFQLKTK